MAQNDINIKVQVDTSQAEKSTINYRQRVRELKDEMTALQLAGKENTAEYAAAAAELGKITDAMSDTSAQARILSDDFFKQRAAMEGLSVGVNIFSGLTQAAALCGVENEDLQKVLVKLQAAQNLANVAMNIAKALNKDTALMTALRAKSTASSTKELNKETSALGKGTVAMGAYATGEGVATAGAVTLKGAVRAVGTAIKSIPVVGWILAAVAALTTLISLISDANEEEEEGVRIKERENQELQKIHAHHQTILEDLRQQNYALQAQLSNLSKLSKDSVEYKDVMGALATQTKLSADYLETLTDSQKAELSTVYSQLQQEEAHLQELNALAEHYQKQWDDAKAKQYSDDEDERKKAIADLNWMNNAQSDYYKKVQENAQNIQAANDRISTAQKNINKERQKELDWQKQQTAELDRQKKAQEYAKKQAQEKAEAEKKYQELLKTTLSELTELNDTLYPPDEEEKLTEKYDRLLDLAIKYYGEESEQVTLLTQQRLAALDELKKKANEATDEANKKAEEEQTLAKQRKLENLAAIAEEGEAKVQAQIDLNNFLQEQEILNAEKTIENTELLEETIRQIKLKYAEENNALLANLEEQQTQKRIEQQQAYWDTVGNMVGQFSNLTNTLMDMELSKVEGNKRKEEQVRKKYAKMNFASQVASIGIDTAKGIMSVWSTAGELGPIAGPIAGAIQTAMIAALGIAQTAAAKSAMDKALSGKAARGAFVTGRSHSQGGELWELEGGEAVLNKRAMSIPAFRNLASAMNEATGGVSFSSKTMQGSSPVLAASVSDEAIAKIVAGITAIPVVVTENDITTAQRNVSVIEQRARF